jgi:protein-S-isoprenylcysteine O-methyltransferase Ste14
MNLKQRLVSLVWQLIFLGALFGSAGTFRWVEAWVFLAIFMAFGLTVRVVLKKHDPALLRERMSSPIQPGQPAYDRIFLMLYLPTSIGWLVVMGLDAVRFGWSEVPDWLKLAGGLIYVLSLWMLYAVFTSNTFLSPVVRHQKEREHTVVETGPYAWVRHPMYAAIGLTTLGVSLMMGSYAGLAVGLIMTVMLSVRAVLEERTLAGELEGYEAYMTKVRYRLIPGIW